MSTLRSQKAPIAFHPNNVENLYKICTILYMRFEWDAEKDRLNLLKHGIDFEDAKNLWLDENRIQIRAPYPLEDRSILISKYKGKLWTSIFTTRGGATRIISVRRAGKKEAKLYEKETTGEKRRGI